MKNLSYLFIFFVFMNCGGQKAEDNAGSEVVAKKVADGPKQWLTVESKNSDAKHIVLISGDEEYRSEETLPQLAKILSTRHGFKCTILFAQDPAKPGIINPNYLNNIPGLEALATADLMIIFTRFRALPDGQMQHIDDYLKTGKPVMGLRTATHAFNFDSASTSGFKHYGNYYDGDKTEWKDGFGRLILGEKWISHHGHHKHQSTRGIVAEDAKSHPIAHGITDGDVWASTDVYGVRLPLPGDSKPIILGQVMNRKGEYNEEDIYYGMKSTDDEVATTNNKGIDPNNPLMPIAWTKSYQVPGGDMGKVFATTLGSSNDMLIEGTRRLLVNGVFWVLDMAVPEKADVSLVGEYQPTKFEFRDMEYWEEKSLKISDQD